MSAQRDVSISGDQTHSVKKMRPSSIAVIVFVGLILTLPAVLFGFPDITPDCITHVVWYTHFAEQFWAGDLYPRWLSGMNGGLGSPVFFFYGPVPYYLTSLLRPFFVNDQYGWHQLGVSASLALIASGLCAYFWLKRITGQNSALVAAILYMAMPYHLALSLYSRSGFTEYWAFVWMPLILYFVDGITRRYKPAIVGLAVSYALLIMTHLPTTLIFSLIPICYAFFRGDAHRRIKVLCVTATAMTLGIGLSAIYLLPAMLTQEFVSMQDMRTGDFYYENWFLFTESKKWGDFILKASLMVLTTAGLAVCAFIISRANSGSMKRERVFWLVIVVMSVFMMTPLSKSVWQIIPALQAIQYPWRFNSVLTVATTALLALGVISIKRQNTTLNNGTLMIAVLLILSWVLPTVRGTLNSYSITLPEREAVDRLNQINYQIGLSRDVPEYRPRWVKVKIKNLTGLESLLIRNSDADGNLVKGKLLGETGSVIINEWKPRSIVLSVGTSSDVSLVISQFYYPGWTACLIGKSRCLDVQPSNPEGLLTISVPAGHHDIILRLDKGKAERAGQIISTVSTLIALILSVWSYIHRKPFMG